MNEVGFSTLADVLQLPNSSLLRGGQRSCFCFSDQKKQQTWLSQRAAAPGEQQEQAQLHPATSCRLQMGTAQTHWEEKTGSNLLFQQILLLTTVSSHKYLLFPMPSFKAERP